ncbi:hypothetical protein NF556_03295 [Ornithinimicrobium faecis]|uniref:Uncharacterized protein n=1 Tax=Ornithinimicrobium faecis TaxID=2934158 RepID=A0ABY4YX61_9MICO|nr:hypothetical protein [Ornithinimicrobium sp. HY1793]USQ80697.1 hypothetical protein NF556_03295 [Ornithinimicrobium sp. HY1793]
MNPEFSGPPGRGDDDRISAQLCRAVGAADFDYATLVDGVHQRAGRIRRRRALTTGAVVAVFGPALLGGSAMVLPGLLPGGVEGTVTPAETPLAALTEEAEPTPEAGADTETAGDANGRTAEAEPGQVQDPPWQETAPPLPEGGLDDANSGNAWEIPDARPTGVAHLEGFGAPQQALITRRAMPVMGAMVGNTGVEDMAPVAGQSWFYYHEDNGSSGGNVQLQVTGWDDSRAARDAIRDDTLMNFVRDTDDEWQRLDWSEHMADDDYLLYRATAGGRHLGFAVVRQGDYLIGVTVTDTEGEINAEVAGEIASKTADNMQALDPVHGRD